MILLCVVGGSEARLCIWQEILWCFGQALRKGLPPRLWWERPSGAKRHEGPSEDLESRGSLKAISRMEGGY